MPRAKSLAAHGLKKRSTCTRTNMTSGKSSSFVITVLDSSFATWNHDALKLDKTQDIFIFTSPACLNS